MDSFRPTTFEDYIGQTKMKELLSVHVRGATERTEALEHVLLHGPPGCGKTTVAAIIADAMGVPFMSMVMPVNENVMRKICNGFQGVVLFDEIHRMSVKQQESLLPLIEDGYYQLATGSQIEVDYLTVIGATTELDKIIKPLYDRFQIKPPFDDYTDEEMAEIVLRMASKVGLELDEEAATKLGRATGGIPRNAKSLVNMGRDLNSTDPDEILTMCRVTPDGLTENHIRYIRVLKECSGQAGVETISNHLGLNKAVIIDLEKLLVKRNMLEYSKQGRILSQAGYKVKV